MISFGRAMRNGMDLSMYNGNPYECACGSTHTFEFNTETLCHGFWRVVAVCPDDPDYLTHVKVRMFLMMKFLGFKGVNGTHLSSDDDRAFLKHIVEQLPWSSRN